MRLNLPLFSQRDDLWKSKKLGNSTVTLGGYGCLVTCLAMVAKYYGKETTPGELNTALCGVKGFANVAGVVMGTNSDRYIWQSLTKVYGDIKETRNVATPGPVTDSQFADMEAELKAGRPVIIEVDMIPATSGVDMHFVVLMGKEGDTWIVADPWYGDTASLTRYGAPKTTVQKYIFTSGPIPVVDTPAQLTDDQKRALGALEGFRKAENHGNLEGAMAALVGDHNDLAVARNQISTKQALIDELSNANKGFATTISALNDQINMMADKLGVSRDFPVIYGELEKLVRMEDDFEACKGKLAQAEEKVAELNNRYNASLTENRQLVIDMGLLEAQIELAQKELSEKSVLIEQLTAARDIEKFSLQELIDEIDRRHKAARRKRWTQTLERIKKLFRRG